MYIYIYIYMVWLGYGHIGNTVRLVMRSTLRIPITIVPIKINYIYFI